MVIKRWGGFVDQPSDLALCHPPDACSAATNGWTHFSEAGRQAPPGVGAVIDEHTNDSELVVAAVGGSAEAFSALIRRHQVLAHRVAYVVSGSASDADDVTQDAFVKAYLNLHRFRTDAPFRPWLLAIVGNEARNRRRAVGRRLHYETKVRYRTEEASGETPEVEVMASAVRDVLLDAVNALPERERTVVGLRYFVELTEEETARALRIPRGTVKSRMSRALRRLRTNLEDSDG